MTTPALRARVAIVSLAVLALAFAGAGIAVTLSYRDGLMGDLRAHLAAGALALAAAQPSQLKSLAGTLELEGIAVSLQAAPTPPKLGASARPTPAKPPAVQRVGSLLVLDELITRNRPVLAARLTASAANVDASVDRLIEVELIAAAVTLAVATLLLARGLGAALAPLRDVGRIAARIAAGERDQRLRPRNPRSELGQMAASFDAMVDALEAAAEQARASESAMRRFVGDASHELRTPIAALQATVETLLREQPPRPDRDALEAQLAREAARLGRLADDLLSLARLEASEPPRRAPLDLAEVARAVAADARARAREAAISVSHDGDARVLGDGDALARALRNLLDNALAATDGGGAIRVELARSGGSVVTRVIDDGPGVAPGERERIFDGFVRLDHGRPGGAGLGLAIARRIARQHGGELRCEECETGACFTLTIPAAA